MVFYLKQQQKKTQDMTCVFHFTTSLQNGQFSLLIERIVLELEKNNYVNGMIYVHTLLVLILSSLNYVAIIEIKEVQKK